MELFKNFQQQNVWQLLCAIQQSYARKREWYKSPKEVITEQMAVVCCWDVKYFWCTMLWIWSRIDVCCVFAYLFFFICVGTRSRWTLWPFWWKNRKKKKNSTTICTCFALRGNQSVEICLRAEAVCSRQRSLVSHVNSLFRFLSSLDSFFFFFHLFT